MKKAHVTLYRLSNWLRKRARVGGGKDEGSTLPTKDSRNKARERSNRSDRTETSPKTTNEQVAANAMGPGNIRTFDPPLGTASSVQKRLPPELQRMLDSLKGSNTPAEAAFLRRKLDALLRLHGPRNLPRSEDPTMGDI